MKKLIILFVLFVFLLPEFVLANKIGLINQPDESVNIANWRESDNIINRNLEVNIVLELFVFEEKLKNKKFLELEYSPGEDADANHGAAEKVKFEICNGIAGGHNYGEEIPIICDKALTYLNTSKKRYKDYKDYNLIIDLSSLKFENGYSKVAIKIKYIIPNFLEQGVDKLFIIETDCFPTGRGGCPNPNSIIKSITLPESSALRFFPERTIVRKDSGRITLEFFDFTPYSPYEGTYNNKVIMFTDLKEERREENDTNRYWFILGIIITIFIEIIIAFGGKLISKIYYSINKKDKSQIKNINFGDAIFNVLRELCNTPTTELHSQNSLLMKLNNGVEIDAPYYGFGAEEFKMLIDQGYIRYWTPNKHEEKLPNSEKSIIATPKAFELIEAKKNRVTASLGITIATYVSCMALFVSLSTLFHELLKDTYYSLIGALIITIIVIIIGNIITKKQRNI